MLRPKRLYTFMLQTFLPVFAMTFFICLFIVLMQFLWRYIDDLVGKGLDISVIAELFFYAALTMVPMALPLSILLASLMTLGNLGEKFELTAMKAAGVSLVQVMKPVIWLMLVISIGAFFFQNNMLPIAQTKMWTLLYSMRQKSPEMEIPEKAFYTDIEGYIIYVDEKDKETGMLHDVMIRQITEGFDKAKVIVADSGRLELSPDRQNLRLDLYNGELYGNMFVQSTGMNSRGKMPNERERFQRKEFLIPFDANFNRMDESSMRKQYIGKNIEQLNATIDSLNSRIDSVGNIYAKEIKEGRHFGMEYRKGRREGNKTVYERIPDVTMEEPIDFDSVFNRNQSIAAHSVMQQALDKARRFKQDYEFKSYVMDDDRKSIRRHGIELHKKFTLSLAVIIFFFIGAPLGAIIKKGGLGLPLVISVILFIIYYIIDNTGYKMARDGKIEVIEGMWISSAVLLPLGVFLTYKAVHDSSVFNLDAYRAFWNKITGKRPQRTLEPKQFTMTEVENGEALLRLTEFESMVEAERKRFASMNPLKRRLSRVGEKLDSEMNKLVDYLSNSREAVVIREVNRYPFKIKRKDLAQISEADLELIEIFKKKQQ